MINIDGLMNLESFVKARPTITADNNNHQNFAQIFQSKIQATDNRPTKPKSGNNDFAKFESTQHSVDSSRPNHENNQDNHNTKKAESSETNNHINETKTDNTEETKKPVEDKDELKKVAEEETINEMMLSQDQIQQLQEYLYLLQQEGLVTEEEAQEILLQLEDAQLLNSLSQDLLSKLVKLLENIEIKIDLQNDGNVDYKEVKDFKTELKVMSKELEKDSQALYVEEKPEVNKELGKSVDTESTRENPKLHQHQPTEDLNSLKETAIEKPTDYSNAPKNKTVEVFEKLDVTEGMLSLEDNKKFEIKLNHVTNESFYSKEIFGKNFLEQLIPKVDAIYKAGKNQLKLQLIPENLGKLSIDLTTDSQNVRAKIYVESLMVKEVIESNLNQFRESLREKGINISDVEVSVGEDPETYQQNRNLAQQRIKLKRTTNDHDQNMVGVQELESIGNTNPYIVTTSFDQLV